jgi:putative cell wall-binding protein
MAQSKIWSAEVTKKSNALDLEAGVFTWQDPRRIAQSLKQSAERSERRKGTPYQSAISMLNFYINRSGKNLATSQKLILEQAKSEIRQLFGK